MRVTTAGLPPTRTRQYRTPTVPEECPQPVADLISQCISVDPAARPTAQQAHQVLTKCTRHATLDHQESRLPPA